MFLRTVFYFQPVYLTIFFIIHLLQVNVYFSLSDYIIKNKNTSRNITVRRTTKKAEGKIRQKAISFEIAQTVDKALLLQGFAIVGAAFLI